MNDGLLGIGYAHAMSPPRTRTPSRESTAIAFRWISYWEPICVLQSHRAIDPAADFRILRDAFTRRIRALLAANISWSVIRAGDLDDPRGAGVEFDRSLCLAIQRRRDRLGRTKGKGKKYANGK